MGVKNELGGSVAIPSAVVVGVIVSLLGGGAGLGAYLGPRVDARAIGQCSQDAGHALREAERAIDISVDHSKEFVEVNDRITILRNYVEARTGDRYTARDASKNWSAQQQRDERQERYLGELERRLTKLERQ